MRPEESRVLVYAPVGQDAESIVTMLTAEGMTAEACAGASECMQKVEGGAGAVLLTEEALELPEAEQLLEFFGQQPPWSELPLIILTSGGESRFARLLEIAAKVAGVVTLLERPMMAGTLLHSVQVALRSRLRQYQVGDLLAERERFTALVTSTSDAVYRMSADWRQMLRLEGKGFISDTEAASDTWMEKYIPVEDQRQVTAAINEAIRTRSVFRLEHRVLRADGTLGWAFSRAIPLLDGDGNIVEWFGTATDITERREFQSELERLVAERTAALRELVAELEHFSYSITHDMRAPLRAMMGFSEAAKAACSAGKYEQQKVFLDRIQTAARRMDLLIADALSYNKAVRSELPLAPVDLGRLLREMVDTYPELQEAQSGIQIARELPPVMGNEAGLTQAFSNLLVNAVKFVKPGKTPDVRVWGEVGAKPEGGNPGAEGNTPSEVQNGKLGNGWVRIWVEDRGIGIGKEMLPRVFNMFARGASERAGTGIGLALVRKVVERMGGRVGVESEEGKGSRFWIELRPGDLRQAQPGERRGA